MCLLSAFLTSSPLEDFCHSSRMLLLFTDVLQAPRRVPRMQQALNRYLLNK